MHGLIAECFQTIYMKVDWEEIGSGPNDVSAIGFQYFLKDVKF
jgi:hypothetical protein